MLTRVCVNQLRAANRCIQQQASRNIGVSAVLLQTGEDPIQQLFVKKIREYAQKSKAAGGQMVDVTEESKKLLSDQLVRLQKTYNIKDENVTQFPKFSFTDQPVEMTPTSEKESSQDLPL